MSNIGDRVKTAMGHRREQTTIYQYMQIAERFALATGKDSGWTREEILRYLDSMIEKGYAYASIVTVYSALKSIFKYLREPFDVEASDLPRNDGKPQLRPVTSFLGVRTMIERLLKVDDKDFDLHKFYLAMSTTYGLRREEMSRLTYTSFDVQDGTPPKITVYVETAKHGNHRTHQVPVQIYQIMIPVIQDPKSKLLPNGPTTLSMIWNELCQRVGYNKLYKESWHSVRRSLATELVRAGIPDPTITNFMRWKTSMGGGLMGGRQIGNPMLNRYYSESEESIDSLVFSKHPYLEMWG